MITLTTSNPLLEYRPSTSRFLLEKPESRHTESFCVIQLRPALSRWENEGGALHFKDKHNSPVVLQ